MTLAVSLILLLSLAAYASNRISLQSVSLAVIAALAVLYSLVPGEAGSTEAAVAPAFAGFASQALVAIVALMVLGRALILTGALAPVAHLLSDALARFPRAAFAAVLIGGFGLSGFLNDTPVVVMLLPILMAAAAQVGSRPGALLMPMNYAVILGGMMTAIGTSTNLLVSGLSADAGGPRFDFFDFYLVALPAALLGLAYLMFVAPWVLRDAGTAESPEDDERFLSSWRLEADGPLTGRLLHEATNRFGRNVRIRHLLRAGRPMARLPTVRLREGDLLVLSGTAEQLRHAADRSGLAASAEDPRVDAPSSPKGLVGQRCIVTAGSPLVGLTVRESAIESRFEVRVTGLSEAEDAARTRAASDVQFMPIAAGDTLLIEGEPVAIERACRLLALVAVGETLRRRVGRDAWLALLVFGCVIALAVAKVLPIAVAAVLGVIACVVFGLMSWADIEEAIEWRIVLIVASSIALGDALVRSGTMQIVADAAAGWAREWPLTAVIALMIAGTGLLTNFVSNNAAAAIMTPLAIELARQLQAPLEPFVLSVLFGANLCFLTPMAYQTNLLVMAAAGYRFTDFPKVGLPLFALMVPTLAASLSWWYLQ